MPCHAMPAALTEKFNFQPWSGCVANLFCINFYHTENYMLKSHKSKQIVVCRGIFRPGNLQTFFVCFVCIGVFGMHTALSLTPFSICYKTTWHTDLWIVHANQLKFIVGITKWIKLRAFTFFHIFTHSLTHTHTLLHVLCGCFAPLLFSICMQNKNELHFVILLSKLVSISGVWFH